MNCLKLMTKMFAMAVILTTSVSAFADSQQICVATCLVLPKGAQAFEIQTIDDYKKIAVQGAGETRQSALRDLFDHCQKEIEAIKASVREADRQGVTGQLATKFSGSSHAGWSADASFKFEFSVADACL